MTVYSQQIRAMLARDNLRCPQNAFWEDLKVDVMNAKTSGDQVIIGGDFNTDMTSTAVREFMEELGLINPVFE